MIDQMADIPEAHSVKRNAAQNNVVENDGGIWCSRGDSERPRLDEYRTGGGTRPRC